MNWASASWSLTSLPNSVGFAALPLRIASVWGSKGLRSLPRDCAWRLRPRAPARPRAGGAGGGGGDVRRDRGGGSPRWEASKDLPRAGHGPQPLDEPLEGVWSQE